VRRRHHAARVPAAAAAEPRPRCILETHHLAAHVLVRVPDPQWRVPGNTAAAAVDSAAGTVYFAAGTGNAAAALVPLDAGGVLVAPDDALGHIQDRNVPAIGFYTFSHTFFFFFFFFVNVKFLSNEFRAKGNGSKQLNRRRDVCRFSKQKRENVIFEKSEKKKKTCANPLFFFFYFLSFSHHIRRFRSAAMRTRMAGWHGVARWMHARSGMAAGLAVPAGSRGIKK
jgi:hypothetical protein